MGGLLHLVQRGGVWAGCGPAQSPPCCTKYNNPPINVQCTNFIPFTTFSNFLTKQSESLLWQLEPVIGGHVVLLMFN